MHRVKSSFVFIESCRPYQSLLISKDMLYINLGYIIIYSFNRCIVLIKALVVYKLSYLYNHQLAEMFSFLNYKKLVGVLLESRRHWTSVNYAFHLIMLLNGLISEDRSLYCSSYFTDVISLSLSSSPFPTVLETSSRRRRVGAGLSANPCSVTPNVTLATAVTHLLVEMSLKCFD